MSSICRFHDSLLTFRSPRALQAHRKSLKELENPENTKRIMEYWSTYGMDKTMSYFHVGRRAVEGILLSAKARDMKPMKPGEPSNKSSENLNFDYAGFVGFVNSLAEEVTVLRAKVKELEAQIVTEKRVADTIREALNKFKEAAFSEQTSQLYHQK